MINNINNKINSNRLYKNQQNKIQNDVINNKSNVLQNQLNELDKSQNKEIVNFLKKINEQINKAELIAIKFIKGKEITENEKKFITKYQPQVKKIIDETINERSQLQNKIKICKTPNEKEKVIQNTINNIQNLEDESIYSQAKINIKIAMIEDIKKALETEKKDGSNIENLFKKLIDGKELSLEEKVLINRKYHKLKPAIEKYLNEIENFKENLEKTNTKEQKQILLSKSIENIEKFNEEEIEKNIIKLENNNKYNISLIDDIVSCEELYEICERLSDLTINELKKQIEKEKDKNSLSNFYMSVYMNLQNLFSKTSNIPILLIIIFMIFIFIVY